MKRLPNEQLGLFTDRGTSFPVNVDTGVGGEAGAADSGEEKAGWYNPELERAGTHFFCHCCCGHVPLDDRSPDSRYCQLCYEVLNGEYQHLINRGNIRKPSWVPRNENAIPPVTRRNAMRRTTIQILADKSSGHPIHGGTEKTTAKNGLSKKLPMRKINRMANQGMKPQRIAAELLKEGIRIDYQIIARKIARIKL